MPNRTVDPARRCLPFEEWPTRDREAFQRAIADGSLLTDAGPAARWRQGTRDRVIQSYGRYLGYLAYHGLLDPNAGPSDRITRDLVIDYAQQLHEQCAPVTVHGYILNLERALAVMAPDQDWNWLARLAARLKARARPSRDKRARMAPVEVLYDLGLRLMKTALEDDFPRPKYRATRFRDGLMIMLLISRTIRLRSLAGLVIGRHLVRSRDGYSIVLAPEDTKNGRPYEAPVPEELVPYLDIYLERMRPLLLAGRTSDRLWITADGADMSNSSIYRQLTKVTKRDFGRSVNPHLFRDCGVTSRGIDDPDNILAMATLLGHSDVRTMEKHYNQAKAIDASRQYQGMITAKRQEITNRAGRKKGE